MKEKTKVKRKNVWKVAELKIKNPNITYREIKESTGLAQNTINKANKELKQNWTKDETIAYIVGSSKDRLKRIQMVLDRFVEESEAKQDLERADTALIKEIAKDDLQRITILWGAVTDPEWWLKESTPNLDDPEQLKQAIKNLLS